MGQAENGRLYIWGTRAPLPSRFPRLWSPESQLLDYRLNSSWELESFGVTDSDHSVYDDFGSHTVSPNSCSMSSRVFRRLHGDMDIVRVRVIEDDTKNQSEALAPHPELTASAQKKKASAQKKKRKKPRTKKERDSEVPRNPRSVEEGREDEVDIAIKEVSNMLGVLETSGPMRETDQARETLRFTRSLLCVERRFLNLDNEMRRNFGSCVVRAEQKRRRVNRRKGLRPSNLIVARRLITKTASCPEPNKLQPITSDILTRRARYLRTNIDHLKHLRRPVQSLYPLEMPVLESQPDECDEPTTIFWTKP